MRGVARFIIALGFYYERQFRPAAREFGVAEQDLSDPASKKLLFLFLGNSMAKQGNLPNAQQFYERALSFDPAYGRAWLGLGELTFQRTRGLCKPGGVDAKGLRSALKLFQRALRDMSPGADVPTKVSFGLGRVYVCLSQAEVINGWAKAQTLFRRVVEDYHNNPYLQEYASEAYAGLGLTYFPSMGEVHAQTRYRMAASAYEEAIRLSPDKGRKGVFYSYLAYAYYRLHDLSRACEAYRQAARLDPRHAARYKRDQRVLPNCA